MKVYFTKAGTAAFAMDDYGNVAEITGYAFGLLIREYAYRKRYAKKSDARILSEIVQGWAHEALNWKNREDAQ